MSGQAQVTAAPPLDEGELYGFLYDMRDVSRCCEHMYRSNVMLTKQLLDTDLPKGDPSPVYVDKIMGLKVEFTKTWVKFFGKRFRDDLNATYANTDTGNDVLRESGHPLID